MNDLFWPTVFLALALLLMSLELFVPSGGLIGVGAVVCLGLGLWNAFQSSRRLGMVFLLVDFVVVPATAIAVLRLWVRSPFGRKFALSPPRPDEIDVSRADHSAEDLVGSVGRTLTPLHPCGHVQVGGRRRDGISEAGLIDEGARIRVVRVRSGQLVVRSIEPPTAEERADVNGAAPPSTLDLGAGL